MADEENLEGDNVVVEEDLVDPEPVVQNDDDEGNNMANPVRGISLSEFYGDPSVDKMSVKAWIAQVDACAKLANWEDGKTASFALMSLRGLALQWSINQQQSNANRFNAWAGNNGLKISLQNRFWYSATFSERTALKQSLVQTTNMSCRDFMDLCETVSYQLMESEWVDVQPNADNSNARECAADADAKIKHHQIFIMGAFTSGLREEIKMQVGVLNPTTPTELLEIATRCEASILDKNKQIRDQSNLEVHALMMGRKFRTQASSSQNSNNNEFYCWQCNKAGHYAKNCRQLQGQNRGKNYQQGRSRGRGTFRGRGFYGNRGRQTFNPPSNKVAEISTESTLTSKNTDQEESCDTRSENELCQGQAAATLLNPYFL